MPDTCMLLPAEAKPVSSRCAHVCSLWHKASLRRHAQHMFPDQVELHLCMPLFIIKEALAPCRLFCRFRRALRLVLSDLVHALTPAWSLQDHGAFLTLLTS